MRLLRHRPRQPGRRHVVLVHRYFDPDTPPYAAILSDIASALDGAGIDVTVLTCQPSYNRKVVSHAPPRERRGEHVVVRRFPVFDDRRSTVLKMVNMLLFCGRTMLASLRLGHVDVMMAASTPPILIATVTSWVARAKSARFVYHHQDIYPEITATEGARPRFFGPLRALDAATDRLASRVVVLSEDMRYTIVDRGVEPSRVTVLNNFDPWDLSVVPMERLESPERTTVVYAGNLGHFQCLDVVFEALESLRDEPLDIHMIGDGPLRPALTDLVERKHLSSVSVHGYLQPDEVAAFLRTRADIGLVTLRPGVVNAAYPSKTMSYLRNGVPVLALVESDSELSRSLVSAGAGWTADQSGPRGLVETLTKIARDPDQLDGAGERAKQLYAERFSREQGLQQWTRLFTELIEVDR